MINTTKVKIPKMYFDKVKFLDFNEETGLYETEAKTGFYFPTINSQWGSAKGHKGIWEVIRYVAEIQEEVKEEVIEEALVILPEVISPDEYNATVLEEFLPSHLVKADEQMNIKTLRGLCKQLGLKNYANWTKAQYIENINKAS
jgi:hypothetical protein